MAFWAAVVHCAPSGRRRKTKHVLLASDDPVTSAVKLSEDRDVKLQLVLVMGKFGTLDESVVFCETLRNEWKKTHCFKKAAAALTATSKIDIYDLS